MFSPKVKVNLLIDSPIVRMQSTEQFLQEFTCTDGTNRPLS